MSRNVFLIWSVALALVGALGGYVVGATSKDAGASGRAARAEVDDASDGLETGVAEEAADADADEAPEEGPRMLARDRAKTTPEAGEAGADDASADPKETRPATAPRQDAECLGERDALRAEVEGLRQERLELLGHPLDPIPDPPERFGEASMSTAIGAALKSEGVAGEVEATDCAEHPCIVFGRLEGDEADMEKIERSVAMAEYRDDVLTLLFWATSVEDPDAAVAPETGLFALAYYATEDREALGEELQRRIRARVMEYWNTDQPG